MRTAIVPLLLNARYTSTLDQGNLFRPPTYLTDVYKVWVCDPNRPYYGVKLPRADQEKFISTLKLEILAMSPVALVTWGRESANSVKELNFNIQHLNFPHPSGAANGTWKKLMNQSPTYENKLKYWSSEISKVLPKSIG